MIRLCIALCCMAFAAGCATLDAGECRTGDWGQIGYRDGSVGSSADILAAHEKACREYGVTPNAKTWRAGYDRGVLAYCTPERGFDEGVRNSTYRGVCPAHLEPYFLQRYGMGREIWKARDYLGSVDRDIRALEGDLRRPELTTGARLDITQRLHMLRLHRLQASSQVAAVEAWARGAYIAAPPPVFAPLPGR